MHVRLVPCLFPRPFLLWLALLALAAPAHAAPSRLHARGTRIVDAQGRPVALRGINLGGWLVEEMWMTPFVTRPPDGSALPPIRDHVSLVRVLDRRFGTQGRARVLDAYRAAWVTEADFDRIHAAGLNCVRLPFLADTLDEPGGWAPLDRAIRWAGARNMYVILDLHGAPGRQSKEDHTGEAGRSEFFARPENVAHAEALWTRIARRYRDNPAVAGYDLLNEPTGTPGSDTLYVVTDRLYRAVRAADPTHLVFVEDGYTGVQWMPFPGPCGWTDVVYSTHHYDFDAKSDADQAKSFGDYLDGVVRERDRRGVPFYVGEFALEPHGTAQTEAAVTRRMDAQGLAWSPWTYKAVFGGGGGLSLWSLVGNARPVAFLDPFRDSEAALIQKCAGVRTESLAVNEPLARALAGG